jgi:hypothetical protein
VDASANVALRFFGPSESGLLGVYGTNLRRWYSSGSIFGTKWQDLAGQHDADVGLYALTFPTNATINGNLAPQFSFALNSGLVAGISPNVDTLAAAPFVDQAVWGCVIKTSSVGDPTYGSILIGEFYNGEMFALHINVSGFLEAWVNNSVGPATSNAVVTDGLAHTCYATWNGATGVVTLYLDGVAQTTTQTGAIGPMTANTFGDDLNIGVGSTSDGNAPYANYTGLIGEPFIANVFPTSAQLTATQSYLATWAGLGAYSLTCAAGSFALNGQAATLRTSLTCAAGAFALTGRTANLVHGYRLAMVSGAFTEAGQAASLTHGYRLTCSAGSFALNGQAATLRTSLTCAAGAFALTGQPATLSRKRVLVASYGAFSVSGSPAHFFRSAFSPTVQPARSVRVTVSGDTDTAVIVPPARPVRFSL